MHKTQYSFISYTVLCILCIVSCIYICIVLFMQDVHVEMHAAFATTDINLNITKINYFSNTPLNLLCIIIVICIFFYCAR